MKFDPHVFRKDFPALERRYSGKPPVYLDSACVTLRPRRVIEAVSSYYSDFPGCHKRASHKFGAETMEKFRAARAAVAKYIGAGSPEEIIFTRNTTEGINLLANTLKMERGDAVLTSELEHNSNFIPWQALSARKGTRHIKFKLAEDLSFDLDEFRKSLNGGVKLVSVASRSHVTGCAAPLREIAAFARAAGALLLVDGAQGTGLAPREAVGAGADFLAFSAHKMLGPSGFGALYVKKSVMEKLPMFMLGGETVADAEDGGFTPAGFPERFEAGLQDYAGALGFSAAVSYLEGARPEEIAEHVSWLNSALTEAVSDIKGLVVLGPAARERGGIFNFYVRGVDSVTLAALLDSAENIMVRAGVHCAHPWFNRTGTPPSLRVSLYLYNTLEEIELFAATLRTLANNFR